jgi:hypothetical protein
MTFSVIGWTVESPAAVPPCGSRGSGITRGGLEPTLQRHRVRVGRNPRSEALFDGEAGNSAMTFSVIGWTVESPAAVPPYEFTGGPSPRMVGLSPPYNDIAPS